MSSDSAESANLYGVYEPSHIAAIVVAAIFFILTVLHLWKIITTRHWFAFATVTGGIFEVIGLAARAVSHSDLSSKAPYIVQVLLILLAPIIFSASIYMFLGRLIRASGYPQLSFIRINWLTKIFVCSDILCFFIQAGGAGKLVNAESSSEISSAQNTVLGGLGLQVFVFCIFMLCAVVFHVRIAKPSVASNIDPKLRVTTMLYSLYFCSFCVIVRNIYRLIEYKEGESGYLQTHEWPAYALDVALMALLMITSLIWYFGAIKAKEVSSYLLNNLHV